MLGTPQLCPRCDADASGVTGRCQCGPKAALGGRGPQPPTAADAPPVPEPTPDGPHVPDATAPAPAPPGPPPAALWPPQPLCPPPAPPNEGATAFTLTSTVTRAVLSASSGDGPGIALGAATATVTATATIPPAKPRPLLDVDTACRLAAEHMSRAGFLLVTAGAGFSADSGLPVYNAIAAVPAYERLGLKYHDLCQPALLQRDPGLFYGFWGACYEQYRRTPAHEGYAILAKWRAQRFGAPSRFAARLRAALQGQGCAAWDALTPFYVFTSNVDGHFRRFFAPEEVHELHGSALYWQCARPCVAEVWGLPEHYHFAVDGGTMRARPDEAVSGGAQEVRAAARYDGAGGARALPGPPIVRGLPVCVACGGPARPNVLMFGDLSVVDGAFAPDRYVDWECAVDDVLAADLPAPPDPAARGRSGGDPAATAAPGPSANDGEGGPGAGLGSAGDPREGAWAGAAAPVRAEGLMQVHDHHHRDHLVILELGCGKNVPSVRRSTEQLARDINGRSAPRGRAQCAIIRINPEHPRADSGCAAVADNIISIASTALHALRTIDGYLQDIPLRSPA